MPLEIGLPEFFVIFLIICPHHLLRVKNFCLTNLKCMDPKRQYQTMTNKILFGRQVMWLSSLTIGWKGSMKLLTDGQILNISSFDRDALAEVPFGKLERFLTLHLHQMTKRSVRHRFSIPHLEASRRFRSKRVKALD